MQSGLEVTVETDGTARTQNHPVTNNLSAVCPDSEPDCQEMPYDVRNSNTNIPPAPQAENQLTMKCSSDSGRSSMREDRSPFVKRLPFQSFLHPKSSSIDDTSNLSQDEEIAMASFHRKNQILRAHSNSFNTRDQRPDISNVRAMEGPPIRSVAARSQHSINNSRYIAEVPEEFRSASEYRPSSTHSRTSDYESNTPTPEITSNCIIDYCADLPMHTRAPKPKLPMSSEYSSNNTYSSKELSGSLYTDKVIT